MTVTLWTVWLLSFALMVLSLYRYATRYKTHDMTVLDHALVLSVVGLNVIINLLYGAAYG